MKKTKKFKNSNFVVHSESVALLDALYKEALSLGWGDDKLWNAEWRRDNYRFLKFHRDLNVYFHNHDCGCIIYNLPKDWDKVIKLISEEEEEECNVKINDWVKHNVTGVKYCVDLIQRDGWCNGDVPGNGWHYSQLTILTPEETKEHLLELAAQKGFVDGVTFLGCLGADKDIPITIGKDGDLVVKKLTSKGWGIHCKNSWLCFPGICMWGKVVELPKVTYRMGQRFRCLWSEYILARVTSCEMVLVNIKTGNILHDKTKVKDFQEVTEEEMNRLTGDNKFELIK